MKLIGIIADHPTPKATLDEVMFTTGASDAHRGGGTAWCIGNGQIHDAMSPSEEVSKTLNCMIDPMKVLISEVERMETVVRRLTPLECARLQGFPEKVDENGNIIGWCDIGDWTDGKGKLHKDADTPKYKALGNSIAVGYANNQSGFWMILMKRISAQYERSATLGSLFDGISGFPLAWARYNGAENCRWASEIEPFCIAVCKKHFGDEDAGIEGDIKDYL